MNVALVKSTVAAGSGFFAYLASFVYGYANLGMLAFLGIFILMMAIQYNALKVKLVIPFVAGVGFLFYLLESFGLNINNILKVFGI